MNPAVKTIVKKLLSKRAQEQIETRVDANLQSLPVSRAAAITEKFEKTTTRVKKTKSVVQKARSGVKKAKSAVNVLRRIFSTVLGLTTLFLTIWALIPKVGKLFGLDLSKTFK